MKIIPNEATVTLPAKDFFEIVDQLNQQNKLKEQYLAKITVEAPDEIVQVELPDNPFAEEVVERVIEQVIEDSDAMIKLARKDEHYYSPSSSYFSQHNWGHNVDLCDNANFAAAWTLAKTILEQEDDDE